MNRLEGMILRGNKFRAAFIRRAFRDQLDAVRAKFIALHEVVFGIGHERVAVIFLRKGVAPINGKPIRVGKMFRHRLVRRGKGGLEVEQSAGHFIKWISRRVARVIHDHLQVAGLAQNEFPPAIIKTHAGCAGTDDEDVVVIHG